MAAKIWKFRKINEDEPEDDYRVALADFVYPKDAVESEEIRNKVGWNKFSDGQNRDMLIRRGMNV